MKPKKEKRGQFIIIAVLLAAIMIVSIGAIMHTAVTYYKHEPWEEYSTLIGDIEINTRRLLELSLANYTNSIIGEEDETILDTNIEKFQTDLTKIYPGSGIVLNCLSSSLQTNIRNPRATADFKLYITEIGLSGYEFSLTTSLSLAVTGATNSTSTDYTITAVVISESGNPVPKLNKNNFMINDAPVTSVHPSLDESNDLVYNINYQGTFPAKVEVWDQRGIRAEDSIFSLTP